MASGDAPEPAGFPDCGRCAYRFNGPWHVCYPCAQAGIPTANPHTCPICSQAVDEPGAGCGNWLCRSPERVIHSIEAISVLRGALHTKIKAYKYDNKTGWGLIFGRVLLGHLAASAHLANVDLIVANPTFIGPNATHAFAHTETVLQEAARQDLLGRFPFEPSLLRVTAEPPKSANNRLAAKRAAALAREALLVIADPYRVQGANIVVYDDVCTTGAQLNVCARVLVEAGANTVRGLVLARRYWGG